MVLLRCIALAPFLLSVVFVREASSAGMVTPSVRCSLMKQAAVTKAFGCVTKARIALVAGGSFDTAPCSDRLTRVFAKEEAKGTCPVTGDAASAFQETLDAEAVLAAALDGDPDAVPRIKGTVRFVRCAFSLVARTIRDSYFYAAVNSLVACYNIWDPVETGSLGDVYAYFPGLEMAGSGRMPQRLVGGNFSGADLAETIFELATNVDFTNANLANASFWNGDVTGSDFTGADLTGLSAVGMKGCDATLPTGWSCVEQVELEDSGTKRYAMVGPHADLLAADFRSSDLSGANLGFADLTAADFGGATLAGVIWSSTTCPDSTSSDANGGTCCGHHVGSAPASCSP